MSNLYLPVFFKFIYIEGVAKTYTLKDEPINWDKVNIIIKRDMTYHGVNYQYTDGDVELQFDEVSGVEIIDLIYSKEGQDGNIVLQYGYMQGLTEIVEYEGKLNLNTYKKMQGRISCTIETAGFHELLKSRIDVDVNLFDTKTLDGGNKVTKTPLDLTLHSKTIQKVCNVIGDIYLYANNTSNEDNDDNFAFTFQIQNPEPSDVNVFNGNGLAIFENYPLPAQLNNINILKLAESGIFKFYLDLYFRINTRLDPKGIGVYPRIEKWRLIINCDIYRDGETTYKIRRTIHDSDWVDIPLSNYFYKTFNIKDEFEFTLESGDHIYIIGEFRIDGVGDWTGLYGQVETENPYPNQVTIFKVTALTQQPPSSAKGMLLYETLNSAVESITNQSNLVNSEYFGREENGYAMDGLGSKFIITNGFFIRNFNIANRALSISFNKILQSIRSIFNVGVGYEYVANVLKVKIEDISYFFQNHEIIRITDCSDYSEETAKEFIYNEVEVGYNKFTDEGEYLLDEFNTKLGFSTPIKTNKNKLILLSDLISSGFSIEKIRRVQFDEKPSDSTSGDDDNFIIAVLKDGDDWKSEKSENFETNNILDSSTSYNLRITPKRNLCRWASWLNGGFFLKKGYELLKNTSFKMNGKAQTKLTGEISFIQENEDVTLSNFGERSKFFNPVWINFKTRLNIDDILIIKNAFNGLDNTRKNGYITVVNDEGISVYGWLYEMSFNPSKEMVTMKILKADISGEVTNCSSFSDWNFGQFEQASLPTWIEYCTFANFN